MYDLPLSTDGRIFSENVYADKFVINGATSENKGFLMSDGTVSTVNRINLTYIFIQTLMEFLAIIHNPAK